MTDNRIFAPWTDAQVEKLNAWQANGKLHPFTCSGDRLDLMHTLYALNHDSDKGVLIATKDGWHCPVCDYTQTWALTFMCV